LGTDGSALPGVTVEARSTILPQARVTTTDETGYYRLPVLPPGPYTLTFSLAGMETVNRNVSVLLNQTATVNVSLGLAGVSETITVTAAQSLVDPESTAIKSGLNEEEIDELPIGQEYRDLIKLAPAVQYTEDVIRGPSAGGSGQDNVYQFDGVNVTLPLFGTLSAEPSTHDIAQVSVVKGAAKAVDFNRAAGFTIDSVSKSGTNEYRGQVSYQLQTDSMRGDATTVNPQDFEQEKSWITLNFGGPLLADKLFFYGSYYRPEHVRTERTNVYGELPDFDSQRNEYFAKLTFSPISSVLVHGSYRDSNREIDNASIFPTEAPTRALNEEATQKIAIVEGSWVVNERSFASFKFTDYENNTLSIPANLLGVVPNIALGTRIDINALETLGGVTVPCPVGRAAGQPCQAGFGTNNAVNAFRNQFLAKYGFVDAGVRTGGGFVGTGLELNDQDFFRQGAQAAYDFTIGTRVAHDLHVGYQWMKDGEDLTRSSNGWGSITVEGGNVNCPASIASCAG
ncbi:MAG TPA: carboxypeptidase-like regulatory domain-containing protein, partial [Vicinamibacterales bacterium]|nr:carboxypeptidase-like regulatory domain-containing protein [Vicinamibacterales bacterium]